ncbi:MAG: hypothetical protein K5917_03830 [Clostridiales bacterium]|nr:hypothetical protein [Clostridiales bacterium]
MSDNIKYTDKIFLEKFCESFNHLQGEKIILYGIGFYTKLLLENLGDKFNFVGIVDKEKFGQVIYGREIIAIEDAVKLAENLIIVSNLSVAELIFKRIENQTVINNITVWFLNGEKPEIYDEKICKNPYWNFTQEQLLDKIKGSDIVSFDLFDTLIFRKTLTPEKIFKEVEEYIFSLTGKILDFVKLRTEIMRSCNAITRFFDIDMIYSQLKDELSFDEETLEKIKQIEIECEIENALPRKYAIELMKVAKQEYGKEVIITSDMYLHTNQLEKILEKCGIAKGVHYDKLYISCEVKQVKYNSTMFKYLEELYCGKKILHIGDNFEVDCKKAESTSIKAFWLLSPTELFRQTKADSLLPEKDTPSANYQKAVLFQRLFDNPFEICHQKGKILIDNMYDFGYLFVAPVVAHYVLWLLNQCTQKDIKTLLFVARDGYILKQAFDIIAKKSSKEIKSVYFLSSRRCSSVASIENEKDIAVITEIMSSISKISFSDFLNKAFAVKCSENDTYKDKFLYEIDKKELFEHIISNYANLILENSEKERNAYRKYIKSLQLDFNSPIAFVNLIGRGVTQKFIEKIIKKEMFGFYLATEPDINCTYENTDSIFSAFGYNESLHTTKLNTVGNCLFLETLFTAPYGSIIKFDENAKPVYNNDKSSKIDNILLCHKGISDYINQLPDDFCSDREFADKLFGLAFKENFILSQEVKDTFKFSDYYDDSKEKSLF